MDPKFSNNISSNLCISMASYDVPKKHRIILAFITSLLCVLTICSNLLLIYSLYKTRLYRTITNKLVIAMSLSDLLTGSLVLPLFMVYYLVNVGNEYCVARCTDIFYAFQYLSNTLGNFSCFMMLIIACDRYFHMAMLNFYNIYMDHFKIKIIITACILLSNISPLFMHFTPSFYLQMITNVTAALFFTITFFFTRIYLKNYAVMQPATYHMASELDNLIVPQQKQQSCWLVFGC